METEIRIDDVSTGQRTSRSAGNHRSSERGMEQMLHQSLQKEPTLPITSFLTSGLYNCERINFYCLKSPSVWYFVTVALGN